MDLRLRRLVGPAVEDDGAVAQLDDPVGRLAHQVEIVGGHDDDSAARVDLRSSWKTPRVARSSRLPVGSSAMSIGGIVHQRAGDRDALLLAAGQLLGIGPRLRREARPGSAPASPAPEWLRGAPR